MRIAFPKRAKIVALALLPVALAGCGTTSKFSRASLTSRECMARVMYFESNRSSDEGMLAVGTVVMNRMESGRYPRTVCGVIGQPNQFAPGVLSKPMNDSGRPRAFRMADAVLSGARHRGVGSRSMFFHTAGYKFPYNNMHYVVIAGGNSFYEKRRAEPGVMLTRQEDVAARQQLAWMGERRQPVPRASLLSESERRVASYERPQRAQRNAQVAAIPIYEEQPREIRVADARPAPYGYDASRGRFEERPVRAARRDLGANDPGSYGYVERAEPRAVSRDEGYEPAPQRVARAEYGEPQSLRAPQERMARPPIQAAEWGDAPVQQPRRRSIDPSEPAVLASMAPSRRDGRQQAQAPRSIEQLIDEPSEAPRQRRGAPPRNLAAPEYVGAPVFVPDN